MAEHDHNGERATLFLIVALAVIGCVALAGMVLILTVEVHPEHAVVFCGLLASTLTALTAVVISAANRNELRQVRAQTNSRMDQLIELTARIAEAKGHADERRDAQDALKDV